MKMCRTPSRTSTQRAVRTSDAGEVAGAVPSDAAHRPLRRPCVWRTIFGSGGRGRQRVALVDPGALVLGLPGQAVERQPEAHRRIARDQEQVAPPRTNQWPLSQATPDRRALGPQRQHVAGDAAQARAEHRARAGRARRIVEARLQHVDVHGQTPLAPQVVVDVLVGRACANASSTARRRASARMNPSAAPSSGRVRRRLLGDEPGLVPDRLPVAAEVAVERPARQLLARVPLPLAVVQEAARREARPQPPQQLIGQPALGRPERGGVPLGARRDHRSRRRSARRPSSAARRADSDRGRPRPRAR